MRKTVTIPTAGKKISVPLTGRSLLIENCNVYPTPADVPTFNFRPGTNDNPIYPRSTYLNPDGQFNSIEVFGTAESAGDTVEFLSVLDCLPTEININTGESYEAVAGTTQNEVLSDSVFSWTELAIQNSDGQLPKSVLVTSSENSIMLAFNADPTQGAGGLGHRIVDGLSAGQHFLEIEGIDFILAARFINRTNGTPATLNYTFRY